MRNSATYRALENAQPLTWVISVGQSSKPVNMRIKLARTHFPEVRSRRPSRAPSVKGMPSAILFTARSPFKCYDPNETRIYFEPSPLYTNGISLLFLSG
jgi:hypothetical protein